MGRGTIRNAVQQEVVSPVQPAVQQPQSAPQPMGGKGGIVSRLGASAGNALGKTYGAQEPTTPQPMGGKGGMAAEPGVLRPAVMDQYTRPFQDMRPAVMPYQPSMPRFTDLAPDFMSPRGATTGGPRTLPTQQQPQFDDRTTQAEFDRARGITPATPALQPFNPSAGPYQLNDQQQQMQQAFMQQQEQENQMRQRMMQQPRFMGGKGGGRFNPYAGGGYNPFGGYGGPEYGNRPFYGQDYGPSPGLGGLAALLQNRGMFYNEGGEVK